MHISFSGVISPYTYHCPWSHYLRNIKKVRIEPTDAIETITEEKQSKRLRGIELHDELSKYLLHEIEEFSYVTDLIEIFKRNPLSVIEQQFFFNLELKKLNEKPKKEHFFSIRPDAFLYQDTVLHLADWKFANSDFNSAKYYNETEFFVALLSTLYPDLTKACTYIHFPEEDYTLPEKEYSIQAIVKLQQKYITLVDRIINDKIFKPNPSKARCYYCDYRSEDAGGCNACEYSVQ